MANILITLVLLPLIAGFVVLFLPNKAKSLLKGLALVISIITFILAVRIFAVGAGDDAGGDGAPG